MQSDGLRVHQSGAAVPLKSDPREENPSAQRVLTETFLRVFPASCLKCNEVLPVERIRIMQEAQFCVATVLSHTKPWQHITPALIHLQRLPVKSYICCKILLLTDKSFRLCVSVTLHPRVRLGLA